MNLVLNNKAANPELCEPLNPLIKYTKIKYCNNILEQDHRRIKTITEPMKGFKNFDSAANTIAGVEAIAMLRKKQSVFSSFNVREVSIADQINLMMAA